MDFNGKTALVTGGASGIGRALCERFAEAGVQVIVVDLDAKAAKDVADSIGGIALGCDMSQPDQITAMIESVKTKVGVPDICVSNAGLVLGEPDTAASAGDADWAFNWDVHVMAHVRLARAMLPEMIARQSGYLVQVASAAGLLCQIGDAAYSATKHAAVSFAQSLAITHGDDGIDVSVVCPQYVATPLLGYASDDDPVPNARVLRASDVVDAIMQGMSQKRFMILPHEEVADYAVSRAADPDAWIGGMRKLRRKALQADPESNGAESIHKLI